LQRRILDPCGVDPDGSPHRLPFGLGSRTSRDQATKTEWIYYPFDGSNVKEIKNVKIKLIDNIMTW